MKFFELFEGLFEAKNKKEVLNVLDVNTIDPNDGDSITVSANMNTVEFSQFERNSSEIQRIQTYRQISKSAEIDEVLSDIINETFIFQAGRKAFELDWYPNNDDLSDQLKDRIYDEFCNIYDAVNFDDIGAELLSSFYVDGRIVFQKIIDKNNPKRGIQKVIWLDPINVVKVRYVPMRNMETKMVDINTIDDFYVYTNKNMNQRINNTLSHMYTDPNDIIDGIRLEMDEITYVTSGLTDINGNTIGHLDKAIIPYNNLKMMEQSMVIFRVVRAPMRRAFYVDVSGMAKIRADELMRNMSNQFRSKVMYNADTGSWVDKQSVISMVEDYFIPRHNDGKTTEIQNIEGQSNQEILDEVNFMQDKLYQALNAPKSRYNTDDQNMFLFGKSDQIPRDEYRYKKFVDRLRNRMMLSIDDILKTQLILKGIITEADWGIVKRAFFWNFTEDNAFIEYKDAEIMNNRITMVSGINDLVDRGYYSSLWVRKNILKQTDEEIEEIDKQVFIEKSKQNSDLPNDNTPQDYSSDNTDNTDNYDDTTDNTDTTSTDDTENDAETNTSTDTTTDDTESTSVNDQETDSNNK